MGCDKCLQNLNQFGEDIVSNCTRGYSYHMLSCSKRLSKEKSQLESSNDESITLILDDVEKIREWRAVLVGPPDSFYEGYEFDLSINVPLEYPMVPPSIKFVSKIFHPNVLFEVTCNLVYLVTRSIFIEAVLTSGILFTDR